MTGRENGRGRGGLARVLAARLLLRVGGVVLLDMTLAELVVHARLNGGRVDVYPPAAVSIDVVPADD